MTERFALRQSTNAVPVFWPATFSLVRLRAPVLIGAKDGWRMALLRWRSGEHQYSRLDQINRDNVAELKIAWSWDSPDRPLQKRNRMLFGLRGRHICGNRSTAAAGR
jgi:hypothetical protein